MTSAEERERFNDELSHIRQYVDRFINLRDRVLRIRAVMRVDVPDGCRQLERLSDELTDSR